MTLENDIRLVSLDNPDNDHLPQEFQDWPNLAHYHEANKNLSPLKDGERRIVFMGDSITEGWANLTPEFFSNKLLVNRGVGGQTTPQMLIRFRPDVIDLNPYAVIILAGTNDIAGNTGPSTKKMITDNIISMAELAQYHNIKVVISSILPVSKYEWNEDVVDPPGTIQALNTKIKDYVDQNNLLYVDYYSAMVDQNRGMKREYSEDGVHPNEAGYNTMSQVLSTTISQLLNE